ncbi:hypothetical protein JVU11DRAFT_7268 [Chiua virens]|nr:hypothetical protein JVU11DRAFT_7268 [Chiua virens]
MLYLFTVAGQSGAAIGRLLLFPCVLWLATLVFGILELYASGSPNTDFFAGFAANVGLAYFALTIGLNVITTSIICARIVSYARIMRNELGLEFASTYFTTASVIVESALPYTLFGIAFLVAFGMQSEFSVLLLSLYGMFTCISPQMLILRVAEGRAWTRDTGSQHLTSLEFAFGDLTGQHSESGHAQTAIHLHGSQPSESSNCHSEKSVKGEV